MIFRVMVLIISLFLQFSEVSRKLFSRNKQIIYYNALNTQTTNHLVFFVIILKLSYLLMGRHAYTETAMLNLVKVNQ